MVLHAPSYLKLRVMKPLIKTLLFTISLFAQHPADSLFKAPDTSPLQKIFLYPIAKWQRFSYNETTLNCQFAPSCSNYGAQAIHNHGVAKGLFMTSDRIIRCNNNAYNYQRKMEGRYHSDGRLIDPIQLRPTGKSSKSPILAAGLSIVIPGLGRAYGGRPMDGFYGFLLSALSISATYKSIKRESVFLPIYAGMSAIIYGGEIYGAYRTTKYYHN
jgi:putative component of membrane protein insertase Oxa1/YidC/SpoIIIJ protein YidD